VNAIVLIGALSLVAPLFGRQALIWFVNAGSLGIVVAYAIVALAFLRLRRLEPGLQRPLRLRHGPVLAWCAFVFAAVLGLLYLPGSPSALAWPWEWCLVLLWTVLGVVLYRRSRMD
jgi:amino acid transporter